MEMPRYQKAQFDAFLDAPMASIDSVGTGISRRFFIGFNEFIEPMHRDGVLTPWAHEYFCMGYNLPPALVAALGSAFDGDLSLVNEKDADLLRRCGLMGRDGTLTDSGRFKYIETLPLSRQVHELGIGYGETPAPASPSQAATTESHVAAKFEARGYRCLHDEGGALYLIIKFALMSNVPALKKLLAHDPLARDSKHFRYTTNLGAFKSRFEDGQLHYESSTRDALLGIISTATTASLRQAIKAYEEEPRPASRSPRLTLSFDGVVELFELLGIDRVVALGRFFLDDERNQGGWPDLTCYNGNEISLVEVKKNDTLMFHQVRALHQLKMLQPSHFAQLRIDRVVRR